MFLQIFPPDNTSLLQEMFDNEIVLFFLITFITLLPFLIKNIKTKKLKPITHKK